MSRRLGDLAEDQAARFLESRGLTVLERNFRSRVGEIDIIARDGDTVVFVEVKSRADSVFGLPQEAVGPAKRRRIIKTALAYAARKGLDCPMRFDVVAMQGGVLDHIPAAFEA